MRLWAHNSGNHQMLPCFSHVTACPVLPRYTTHRSIVPSPYHITAVLSANLLRSSAETGTLSEFVHVYVHSSSDSIIRLVSSKLAHWSMVMSCSSTSLRTSSRVPKTRSPVSFVFALSPALSFGLRREILLLLHQRPTRLLTVEYDTSERSG